MYKTIKEKTQVFEKSKVRYMGKFEGGNRNGK